MDLEVRLLDVGSKGEILALVDGAINERDPNYVKDIANTVKSAIQADFIPEYLLGAYSEEILVGALFANSQDNSPETVYVHLVYVEENSRRTGAATRLFQEVEVLAKGDGKTSLFYHLRKDNSSMARLGLNLGFVSTDDSRDILDGYWKPLGQTGK